MQPIKPHWAWFFLGPLILVFGGVAAIVLMIGGLSSATDGMQRVDVPGTATVRVDEPGYQTIFFEAGGSFAERPPDRLEATIVPLAGGEPLTLESTIGDATYNMNGVAGRSWRRVNFPAAGGYTITSTVPLGNSGGKLVIGGDVGERIAFTIVGFFGIGFGSFILCVIVVIVVLVKRINYRKRMMQQQYAAIPQGGMVPPPGASY
jgi:hypothetical protein